VGAIAVYEGILEMLSPILEKSNFKKPTIDSNWNGLIDFFQIKVDSLIIEY